MDEILKKQVEEKAEQEKEKERVKETELRQLREQMG
jgi:hypothetical protein